MIFRQPRAVAVVAGDVAQLVNVATLTAADCRRAGESDRFEDAVDYRALKKRILELVGESQFHLIEALAQSIADECLRDERVERVEVAVEKPGALRFARKVEARPGLGYRIVGFVDGHWAGMGMFEQTGY